MKHSREKFKLCMGLGFAGDRDMKMLSKMAAKGWIFYKFQGLWYKFKKGEDQELIYTFDSVRLKNEDKAEYLEVFKVAGWNHVCSIGEYFHFFSAKPGTAPIYSDKNTKEEANNRGIKDVLKASGYILVFSIVLLIVKYVVNEIYMNEVVDFILLRVTAFFIGFAVMLMICAMFMKFKKRKI